MSETKYARDRVLRIDSRDAQVLIGSVMARITELSALRQRMEPGSWSDAHIAQELGILRSLLERLCD